MKKTASVYLSFLPVSILVGCSTMPSGPSVLVLPGAGKTFDQFRIDDMRCRQYALMQSGGVAPSHVAASSAVTGTAVGAAAGGALGGGEGAAIGAGTGLLAGTITGSESARLSGYEAQQRYDISYIQCMYAYGNRVPVNGTFIDESPYSRQYPYPAYPPPPETQPPELPPR